MRSLSPALGSTEPVERRAGEPVERRAGIPVPGSPPAPGIPAAGHRADGHPADGASHGHHGELLQGAIRSAGRARTEVLVTLPCAPLESRVRFTPDEDREVRCEGPLGGYGKAVRAARRALDHLGLPQFGGILAISGNIPRGYGYGSSTADVLATLRAVAGAFDRRLDSAELAALAVEAEGASDALMWPEPVVFAQNEGRVIRHYPSPLPPFSVIASRLCGDVVETDHIARPSYTDRETGFFETALDLLGTALQTRDLRTIAELATGSSRIDQAHRPRPALAEVLHAHIGWGALGVQIAHSGTAVGLIVPPASGDDEARRRRSIAHALEVVCGHPVWSFDVH